MSNAVQTACKHSPSEHTAVFTDRPTTFICNKTPGWQGVGPVHSWPQLGNLKEKVEEQH